MKPKIELGREYKTRGGGKAVVYRDDGAGRYPLIGALNHDGEWMPETWMRNGRYHDAHTSGHDIILPRTVMVPVEIPEWARFVKTSQNGMWIFIDDIRGFEGDDRIVPLDDWIAELEGDHRA